MKPEDPSVEMFYRRFTKLVIYSDIKPGDKQVFENMKNTRKAFKQEHKGHDDELHLYIDDDTVEKFLVRRDDNDPTPGRFFNKTAYWVFTFLALSLPYRWYLYCSMGHIKFKVKRRVFGQGTRQAENIVNQDEPNQLQQLQPKYELRSQNMLSEYNEREPRPHYGQPQPSQYYWTVSESKTTPV